jgi:HlyD family secretion protein
MSELTLRGAGVEPDEFDESWFEQGTNRWRGRIVALVVAAAIAAVAAFAVWNSMFRGGGEAAPSEQIVAASIGTVTDSIETSGTVASQSDTSLSFSSSGQVESVNVTLGQEVREGDVLATLDAPDLEDSVRRAEISLISAQLQLNELMEGADAAQLASADESYQRALTAYEEAVEQLDDLRAGPTSTELSAAQQVVVDADAALAQAQAAREELDSSSGDAIDNAESALGDAEDALDRAKESEDDAASALDVAGAQLQGAENAYCPDASVSFCGSPSVPLSIGDESTLRGVVAAGGAKASLASDALDANTTYEQRATALSSAEDNVEQAEDAVDDAESALDDTEVGATSAEIKSADAKISSAQLALTQAEEDLADVQDGASAEEIRAAEREVASADSSLTAADASRSETYAGADSKEITEQQNQVELAQMSLAAAQRDLEDAQLIAPFDGTVAELNVTVGDEAGGGGTGDTETTAAIVLNTPDALIVELAISEEDLSSVEVGQTGTATFDQLDGAAYPITITEIGSSPTTTQGVVTYDAVASIDLSSPVMTFPAGAGSGGGGGASALATAQASGELPAEIATAIAERGGAGPDANATPTTGSPATGVFTPPSQEEVDRPAPGMSATIAITIDEATDVIVVPSGAVQQEGPQEFVEVVSEDGSRERVAVQSGLSDGSQTAIVQGLEEGQQVVVPAASATGTGAAPAGGFPGGGFPGGGGGPGGGGFGGGGGGLGGGGGQ